MNGEERDGFIDRSGKWALPPVYALAQSFSEGLAQVRESIDGTWLYIDKTGRVIFDSGTVYDTLAFSEGLASIQVCGDRGAEIWQCVNRTGKVVLGNLRYRMVGIFREGRAFVENDAMGWGIIDTSGSLVFPTELTGVNLFHGGLARVETGAFFEGTSVAYLDRDGQWVWKPRK